MKNFLLLAAIVLFSSCIPAVGSPRLTNYLDATHTWGVIYINNDGEIDNNPNWSTATINATNAGQSDLQIVTTFNAVCAKYDPLTVVITTDSNVYKAAKTTMRVRCCVTTNYQWYAGVGGVAYVGAYGNSVYDPAWVFSPMLSNDPIFIADAIAHECGHTLGLQHHGQFDTACKKISNYSAGKGSGQIGNGQIMGAPYGLNMIRWDSAATTTTTCTSGPWQDDLKIITTNNNGIKYRTDDAGNAIAMARTISPRIDSGIIERNTDIDFYKVIGPCKLSIYPKSNDTSKNSNATLDIKLIIYDSIGNVIRIDTTPIASLRRVDYLTSGTHYFSVSGYGLPNFVSAGSTHNKNYGNVGKYYIYTSGVITPPTCATPTALSSSNITTTSATLLWGSVTNATSYILKWQPANSTNWNTVSITTGSSYNLTGLNSAMAYNFITTAICTTVSSNASLQNSFTTASPPPPPSCGTATGLVANNITATTANLSWASATNGIGYTLKLIPAGGTATTINVTGLNYSVTGLTPGIAYTWSVQTICAIGTGTVDYGTFNTVNVPTCTPSTLHGGTSDITVNWPFNGALSYTLQYRQVGTTTITITGGITTNFYIIKGIPYMQKWEAQIQNTCQNGITSPFGAWFPIN